MAANTTMIVAAALSTPKGEEYFEGPEWRILSALDQRFTLLRPGIISTWKGSILDLPPLRLRAISWRQRRHLDLCWIVEDEPDRDDTEEDPCRGAQLARSLTEHRLQNAMRCDSPSLAGFRPDLTAADMWADLGEDYGQPRRSHVPEEAVRRHPSTASTAQRRIRTINVPAQV